MKRLPILLMTAALAATAPASADKGGKDGHSGKHGAEFSSTERARIDAYFATHPDEREKLPPGLAKKGKVPPGWNKKLERGQRVPDDLWEHRQQLPRELNLPPPPEGIIVIRLGERVIKVREKTREILDILGN